MKDNGTEVKGRVQKERKDMYCTGCDGKEGSVKDIYRM